MEDVYYHKIKVVINVDVMNHEKNDLEIDKTSCMRVCDGHTYIKEEIRGHLATHSQKFSIHLLTETT